MFNARCQFGTYFNVRFHWLVLALSLTSVSVTFYSKLIERRRDQLLISHGLWRLTICLIWFQYRWLWTVHVTHVDWFNTHAVCHIDISKSLTFSSLSNLGQEQIISNGPNLLLAQKVLHSLQRQGSIYTPISTLYIVPNSVIGMCYLYRLMHNHIFVQKCLPIYVSFYIRIYELKKYTSFHFYIA